MNGIRKILIFCTLSFWIAACTYDKQTEVWCIDPPEAVLPDSVGLGESVLYLNGEKVPCTPEIVLGATHLANFSFSFQHPSYAVYTRLGLGPIPLRTGSFKVISLEEYLILIKGGTVTPTDEVLIAIDNSIGPEDTGLIYRTVDLEKDFFQVEALDTISRTARARFKIKFCLDSRNGLPDVGLPNTLLFQGVINEVY